MSIEYPVTLELKTNKKKKYNNELKPYFLTIHLFLSEISCLIHDLQKPSIIDLEHQKKINQN